MCNLFFCYNVFKKLSAAEASESVYMRERFNAIILFPFNPSIIPQISTYESILIEWVENIVAKGEMAHHGTVSPFATMLSKFACLRSTKMPERVNPFPAYNKAAPDDFGNIWIKI